MKTLRSLALIALLVGCGGGTEAEPVSHEESAGSEQTIRPHNEPQITGILGTIRPAQVEMALSPRMNRFMRCFADRMGEVEYLAGSIRMAFRIHQDGSVAWVYPSQSDIGDRATERCVLQVASGTRFARPHGGEAEFSWGFGFDAAEDIRPPLNWSDADLGSARDRFSGVLSACETSGPFQVTAYVAPGGHVVAAGGSVNDAESLAALDCVLERVSGWTLQDPGSYAAKVSFALP